MRRVEEKSYSSDRKTDGWRTASVTAERSLRNVKCRDTMIDSECRRRDAEARRVTSRNSVIECLPPLPPCYVNDIRAVSGASAACVSYFHG